MGRIILPLAGLGVGSLFGAPMMGLAIGEMAAGLLFPVHPGGSRLSDLKVQGSSYGTPIPIIYGSNRVAGNVIWSPGIQEHKSSGGGGGGKGGGGGSNANYYYTASLAVMVCEGPVQIKRIWANTDVLYDNTSGSPRYAQGLNSGNIRVYNGYDDGSDGNPTQNPDSLLQAAVGSSLCPAYRGRCYVVFQDFNLTTRYGNVIPNFTFEVAPLGGTSPTLSSIVSDLTRRTSSNSTNPDTPSIQSADLNLAATNGILVTGYTVFQRVAAKTVLDDLQTIYHFDIAEIDGQLTTIRRSTFNPISLTDSDLGAIPLGEGNQSNPDTPRVQVQRGQDVDNPRRVDIVYFSQGFNYQAGLQSFHRETHYSSSLKTLSIPIVLDDTSAREIAATYLLEQWMMRDLYHIQVPWRWLTLAPGDVLYVPSIGGEIRTVKVKKMTYGSPGHIEIEGYEYDPDIYSVVLTGFTLTGGTTTTIDNAGTVIVLADVPALRLQDTVAGFYAGASSDGTGPWHGATLYGDSGAGPVALIHFDSEATLGVAVSTLPTAAGGAWDTTNFVDVMLNDGSLQTISQANLNLNPLLNLCVLGGEVLQFSTATLLGTSGRSSTYRLTTLKRGLKGTLTTGHSSGDKFMVINDAVRRVNLDNSMIGLNVQYTAVTDGQAITDATTTSTTTPPTNTAGGGVANPSVAPTLTGHTTGGTLPTGTYTVGYTWTTVSGETQVSPTSTVTTTGTTGSVTTGVLTLPSGVTGVKWYMSLPGASIPLYFTGVSSTTGAPVTITTLPASGGANTTFATSGNSIANPSASYVDLVSDQLSINGLKGFLETIKAGGYEAHDGSVGVAGSFTLYGTDALGSPIELQFGSVDGLVTLLSAQHVPNPPTNFEVVPGNTKNDLVWFGNKGASRYAVYWSTTSGGPYSLLTSSLTFSKYTHTGLTNGTTYYYIVTEYGYSGTSLKSSEVSGSPSAGATVPTAPTITSHSVGDTQFTLQFTVDTLTPQVYVGVGTVTGGPYTWHGPYPSPQVASNQVDIDGLTNGTTYYVVMKGNNSVGDSPLSTEVSLTPAVGTLPTASVLTVTPGVKSNSLSWTASTGVTTYAVLRSADQNGIYMFIVAGLTATTYNDTGLLTGETYWYKVVANNGSGSVYSATGTSGTPT